MPATVLLVAETIGAARATGGAAGRPVSPSMAMSAVMTRGMLIRSMLYSASSMAPFM